MHEAVRTHSTTDFQLGIEGFHYSDVYRLDKLHQLYDIFYDWLAKTSPEVFDRYAHYRKDRGEGWKPQDISQVIIDAGRYLDSFIGILFQTGDEQVTLQKSVLVQKPIFRFKKDFLQRRVWKKFKPEDAPKFNFPALDEKVNTLRKIHGESIVGEYAQGGGDGFPDVRDDELTISILIDWLMALELDYKRAFGQSQKIEPMPADAPLRVEFLFTNIQKNVHTASIWNDVLTRSSFSTIEEQHAFLCAIIDVIEQWAFAVYFDPKGKEQIKHWVSYKFPEPMEYMHLVHVLHANSALPEEMIGPAERLRRRDGFKLTDRRYSSREIVSEVEYCIFCHDRDKDSCSKGIKEKDGKLKHNPLGIKLSGCPLDEKISEMHLLKDEGLSVGALAAIIIDNPMLPGTGHRICNDCMKSCIYQKQEPVNIPQIETAVLTDVLNLPYGFEIYSFLTRWNPLNVHRPVALPYNGKNILVVGLGPAGYTLAHYLLNEGFGVVGIDGLKIEPLPDALTGSGQAHPKPITYISEIRHELDERIMMGFGGVSEYGITVRWDKNFLDVIYLTLARRDKFKIYGGVRFGGTMTIDDAWSLGFDHIAIATGAGKPTIVDMKNNMSRGIRMASDFLMALQLTGAAKKDSLANLQVQLPAIVIGGGLTGIDTATELMAYYPVMVEKIYSRFQRLVSDFGEETVWKLYDEEEKKIMKRYLEHAKEIQVERERARQLNEQPNFVPLLRKWGGVKLVYRKSMIDAPAYRLNHEEIIKFLEEGVSFVECMSPVEAKLDKFSAVEAMVFERQMKDENGKWKNTEEYVTMPARTVMIAAGTSPNTIYEREQPGTFKLDKWNLFFIQHIRMSERSFGEDDEAKLQLAENDQVGFFTSYQKNGKYISYYGDNHPVFAGNVVKAMASARKGYKQILSLFKKEIAVPDPSKQSDREKVWKKLSNTLDDCLLATVVEVKRYTPTIVDVIVKARFASRKFHPGQFYRLQNYEASAIHIEDTKLAMEGLALTGAWVDKEKGLLSMIVLEMGHSSRLCSSLKPGERVVVMGPTGAPTEIPIEENVLLAGGGLGNAVLFSIAKALKDNGCNVIYFAGYKKGEDLYKREEIEASTTQVIWSTDTGAAIEAHRKQDAHFRGNIVQAMKAYSDAELGEILVPLHSVARIIAIGSDRMMAAVKEARHGVLAPYLRHHIGIGSINSPMQCMMKEVCAQCLQRHVDPETGKEKFVFSCFYQDQPLDEVDWKNLNDRLKQNSVLEKLSNLYLDYLLKKEKVEMI